MAKYENAFLLSVSPDRAVRAFKSAALSLDLDVQKESLDSLEFKNRSTICTYKVTLTETREGTRVLVRVSRALGWGPLVADHLKGQFGSLRNAVELAISGQPESSLNTIGAGVTDELFKLEQLRASGTLTDEEFQRLKEKLIS